MDFTGFYRSNSIQFDPIRFDSNGMEWIGMEWINAIHCIAIYCVCSLVMHRIQISRCDGISAATLHLHVIIEWNLFSLLFYRFFSLFFSLFLERLNVLYERNWTMLVHEQLRRFEGSIIKATKGGLSEAMGERLPRWTFTEALLYSITLITTIGNYRHKICNAT